MPVYQLLAGQLHILTTNPTSNAIINKLPDLDVLCVFMPVKMDSGLYTDRTVSQTSSLNRHLMQ